ncbi:MAG: D-lyxose/D-mannose family sugar isomerase, partial [Casimicrobiaceae bacterium]
TEDIISYHGGTLMIQLYNARDDETMDESSPGHVYCDGVRHAFEAGEVFEIPRGGSLTITPKLYHRFWAKDGAGVLVGGEISTISVPKTDNRFGGNARRFTPIDEDEPARYLLNIDYPKLHELA